jgi:YD repeat-containing protein
MMQMAISRVLSVLTFILLLGVLVPMSAIADQVQYIYDGLGRLSQVIDGQGTVATCQYDAVGNPLSITRNSGGVGAPTVTGIMPNREGARLMRMFGGGR